MASSSWPAMASAAGKAAVAAVAVHLARSAGLPLADAAVYLSQVCCTDSVAFDPFSKFLQIVPN